MLVVKVFEFSPIRENTYLLYNERRECIIIDPGCYFEEERDELKTFIESASLLPKFLLNTHCHLDHVFGNKWVAETYGLILHIHEKEKPVLDYAPTAGLMWNLPFESYEGDLVYLRENESIKLGLDELKILLTPGHSPGSVVFYCQKQEFVIGGDVLFRMSIGRTDLPGGDYDTLIESIRSRILVLPDQVKIYPGHGEPTTVGFEKKHNPFLKNEA